MPQYAGKEFCNFKLQLNINVHACIKNDVQQKSWENDDKKMLNPNRDFTSIHSVPKHIQETSVNNLCAFFITFHSFRHSSDISLDSNCINDGNGTFVKKTCYSYSAKTCLLSDAITAK